MPDRTNVLITYAGVCAKALGFRTQAWGFALFNWKTNRFTSRPFDVYPASNSGAALPQPRTYGSPIVVDGEVVLYSRTSDRKTVYATSVPADLAALKDQASYDNRQELTDVDGIVPASVAPRSPTQPNFTMIQFDGRAGRYQLREAPDPRGPWTAGGSGILPGCSGRPNGPASDLCFSLSIHSQLSSPSGLLVTYFLPGYGPGIGGMHPFGGRYFGHVVMASLPI
jgi:hypothetical protein